MNTRTVLFLSYVLIIGIALVRIILYKAPLPLQNGQFIAESVRVRSQTSYKDTYHSFRTLIRGREVRIVVDRYTAFEQGDLLRISGTIKNTVLGGGETVSSIHNPHITILKDTNKFFQARSYVVKRVKESFGYFLPPDESHLLMGIVFGINTGFPARLTDAFATTGVMHVIAASGMNVTLLGGFISKMLARYTRRRVALGMTIGVLIVYAFLAGFGASIVRATIMGIIAFGAGIYGRQNTGKLALLATGLIMLIISPDLLTDVGFQLSFGATIGIMWLGDIFPKIPERLEGLLGEDLKATVSAQLATFPIILFYFGSIGILSPIINLLVLWIVPPVMVIGLVAAVIGLFSSVLGGIASLFTWPFLTYFLEIVKRGGEISPSLKIEVLPATLIASYYLLLSSIYFIIRRKRSRHE